MSKILTLSVKVNNILDVASVAPIKLKKTNEIKKSKLKKNLLCDIQILFI